MQPTHGCEARGEPQTSKVCVQNQFVGDQSGGLLAFSVYFSAYILLQCLLGGAKGARGA